MVPDESTREPLAAPLIDAILALLFKHEFTLATASDTAVWEGGMGGSAASGKGTQYDAARADILKLFLVSCSETLFVTPGQRICLASYSLCMNVDFTSPLGGMPGMSRDSRSENLGAAAAAAADEYKAAENKWLSYYTSRSAAVSSRVLVSLCNAIFSYDPVAARRRRRPAPARRAPCAAGPRRCGPRRLVAGAGPRSRRRRRRLFAVCARASRRVLLPGHLPVWPGRRLDTAWMGSSGLPLYTGSQTLPPAPDW